MSGTSEGARKSWAMPSIRKRRVAAQRKSWTPERRAAHGVIIRAAAVRRKSEKALRAKERRELETLLRKEFEAALKRERAAQK